MWITIVEIDIPLLDSSLIGLHQFEHLFVNVKYKVQFTLKISSVESLKYNISVWRFTTFSVCTEAVAGNFVQ